MEKIQNSGYILALTVKTSESILLSKNENQNYLETQYY